ncbi:hypothetical protein MMC21_000535 [Puttea exsequens]|nr:hypothetical protein [Puttea exsequens]
MQEVILAKGIFVLCGKRTISWAAIVDFAEAISAVYPAILLQAGERTDGGTISGFVSCSQINKLKTLLPTTSLMFFCTVLKPTRDREAGNQLDRIYGLLGLVSAELLGLVTVSYGWNLQECYVDFCKTIIQREPTMSLLSMAASKRRTLGLPSWCPDFSSLRAESTLYSLNAGFMAGYEDWGTRRSAIQVTSSNGKATIKIPGFRVDTVKHVAERHSAKSDEAARGHDSTAAIDLAWEAECLLLYQEALPPSSTTQVVSEAYCRTLIADHFDPAHPVPPAPTVDLCQDYKNLKRFWTDFVNHEPAKRATFAAKQAKIRYSTALMLQQSRKFFNTEGGRIGLGPSDLQAGDVVCVFYSAGPLLVLRLEDSDDKAGLVGDAFVSGL